MNPKNALFLSASLTAFVLAVLFGVVTKLTNNTSTASAAAASAALVNTASPTLEQATATNQAPLGPEEAASLAADSIGHTDVYSVESFVYEGVDTFKVVFSSGDIVYMGLDRTVMGTGTIPAVTVNVEPTKNAKKRSSGSNNTTLSTQQQNPTQAPSNNNSGDHKEDDHKEDEHDD